MIVDAHHHFWDPATADYPWLTDELAAIRRPVQAGRPRPGARGRRRRRHGPRPDPLQPGRDRRVPGTRRGHAVHPRRRRLGRPDRSRASRTPSPALRAGPGGDRLVGHPPPGPRRARPRRGSCATTSTRGIRAVGAAGLAYDLLVRPRELPAALELARRLPDVRFVIDHLAKPPIATGALEPWRSLIAPFAELEHVACKVSGLVTEADWSSWTAGRPPAVSWITRSTSSGRSGCCSGPTGRSACWPRPTTRSSRRRGTTLAGLTDDEQAAVMGGNATRIYGL